MKRADKNGNHGARTERAYVINPALDVVFCGEDEVLVLHGTRSNFRRIINDEGRKNLLARMLRSLDTPASVEDLILQDVVDEEHASDAADLVEYLASEDVLVDPAERLTSVYLRTLNGQEASPLADRSIGFVGIGPLGARVAQEMAQLDVGHIYAMDDRVVERVDVDRHQFGRLSPLLDEGKRYTECLRQSFEASGMGDRLSVQFASATDEDSLRDLLETVDFAVVAAESLLSGLFHRVDDLAMDTGTPWISAFVDGSEACIGPLYVPGETCCYNEFEIQCEAALSISQADYYIYKEELNKHGFRTRHLMLPAHLSTAAGFIASGITSFLGYQRSYLVGRALRVNFESLRVDYEEVLRLPRTPTRAATRQGYRHTFM
jgi:bacteriocin biosynthesis cyclodehydratase domain-containing protein